ncbi:tRNA-specific adenosine deaminase [compost metagenome]
MDDSAERYADRTFKYAHVVHAEMNAIISAGRDLNGCTVYITHPPCTTCLCAMKQAMVARVVCGDGGPEFQSRWCQEGLEARQDLANELGIELIVIPT